MNEISDLEREFQNEEKGEGSLSVFVKNSDGTDYLGYDINPEDLEAVYFDGIGVPRWESLKADTVEKQTALYWEKFNELMGRYPLIGRVRDTDKAVEYSAPETSELIEECEKVAGSTDEVKALRSISKFTVAAGRAVEQQAGLMLKPSQLPDVGGGF